MQGSGCCCAMKVITFASVEADIYEQQSKQLAPVAATKQAVDDHQSHPRVRANKTRHEHKQLAPSREAITIVTM